MTKRQKFWLQVVIATQSVLIIGLIELIFLPEHHGDFMSPAVELKEIHDLAIAAKQSGKILAKADVEKKVAEIKSRPRWNYGWTRIEVIGTDSHWTVLLTVPRERQTKFQILLLRDHEWPAYMLSSDDDGWIEISPYGKITHLDFNW